jgi:hypothetical protein
LGSEKAGFDIRENYSSDSGTLKVSRAIMELWDFYRLEAKSLHGNSTKQNMPNDHFMAEDTACLIID